MAFFLYEGGCSKWELGSCDLFSPRLSDELGALEKSLWGGRDVFILEWEKRVCMPFLCETSSFLMELVELAGY